MNQNHLDKMGKGSHILADVRIDGDLKSDRIIYLDGMILGKIESSALVVVNQGGVIDGDLVCDELLLYGRITGEVCVMHKTSMAATAVIEGGLITDRLEIVPGARIGKGLKLKKASK